MSPKSVKDQEFTNKKTCVFCNISDDDELKYGKIYEYENIVTHYYCLLLSSNMQQRGRDEDGILGFLPEDIHKELNRGRRLSCSFCKKKGATLGCVNRKCKKVFHYPCGIKANTLHQFFGQFKSFCATHRPKQNIDLRVRSQAPDHLVCYICYEPVKRDDIHSTLWAPCCKKNAWFHRDCVQQLALSAGYFFKCPLCNNKKEFLKSMQECGIFVPSQDASWELVPNAFQELLYRHNRCDAPKCICPQGRTHTNPNAKWEIILCQTCGSQGIHVGCGKLKWLNPSWECDECSSILQKSNLNSSNDQFRSQDGADNSSQFNSDDDSDSDISAGRESPYQNIVQTLNIPLMKLKPGPRSAKLKQLHQKVETETSGHTTTMEVLSDILDEQQANQFPDEIFERKKTAVNQETPNHQTPNQETSNQEIPKSSTDDLCVITLEDDDDSNDLNHPPPPSETTKNNSVQSTPVMNIKITEVTSLPPEVFANVPDTSFRRGNQLQNNLTIVPQRDYQDRRRADSPSIVSRIVSRVNDYLDIPELCPKKPRMDENFVSTNGFVAHPTRNFSQTSHSTMDHMNNINLYPTHIPINGTFNTNYNGFNTQVSRFARSKDPKSSNSDEDAGINPTTDKLIINVSTDADSEPDSVSTECSNTDTELSESNPGLSLEECGGRRSRNGGRCKEWTSRCNSKGYECHNNARSNRLRLMKESVLLKNLKFRVCEGDNLEITVCNDFKFKIMLDSAQQMDSVNTQRSTLCDDHDLTRSSPVRRSRATYYNKIEDFPNYSSSNINLHSDNIELKKPYRITNLKDVNKNHFSYSLDSSHSLRLRRNDKNKLSECYKYNNNSNNNNEDVAKENLVPEKFEKQSNNFDSPKSGKSISRLFVANGDFPGTSRDSFRELSMNQKQFFNSNHSNAVNQNMSRRSNKKSISKSFKNIKCHVSIELNRIQSLIDSKPNLFMKNNNSLVKTTSLNNLHIGLENQKNLHTINGKKRIRSYSESSIHLSTMELDQIFYENQVFNSKKKKKRKNQFKRKYAIER
ncbi:probable inactive serine/threonine-protein kinase scy2 [Chelonus insularis]|uniref:probable inactive serine/threonine-protein kinase scy2 n=1 Tax=Chelonus insularis TaxID=460826 RepID=UPI00158D1BBF|nr:probable inactive serine/threonine-protein kinase scy2 [Chelonus insularis]